MSPLEARHPVIAVIGSLNVDLVTRTTRIPSGGETLAAESFDINFGGKGANQAVACARLSRSKKRSSTTDVSAGGFSDVKADVRMIGAIGDDPLANGFLKSLESDGIDVSGVRQLQNQKTGVAVIVVEEKSGENRIMLAPNANHAISSMDLLPNDIDVAVLQLEIPLQVVLSTIERAKKRGVQVILNPAPAVPLPNEVFEGLGHLIMNESEAAILSGRDPQKILATDQAELTTIANNFIGKGVKRLVITLGKHGAFYYTAKMSEQNLPGARLEALKVNVVDTTAAGDTFVGAYAVAVATSQASSGTAFDIEAAVKDAIVASAITVQRKGAQVAIPWLDEIKGR